MSEGKLYPVEPTLDMLSEGMGVYGFEDCAEAEVLAIYTAMRNAAPDVKESSECPRCKGKGRHVTGPIDCPAVTICKLCSPPISRNLRGVHAMILNALDRDAADGKAVRGEMAAELRSAIAEQQPAPDVAELNILLDDIRNAAKFFQSVKSASDAGEDCTINGGWKDANEWLKEAALALGSALEEVTDD